VVQRPATGTIPEEPGSYQFKDGDGRVIYVGKAKSLRQRLNSYFADPRLLHPKTAAMVAAAETVEWITVRNEVEAFFLEYSLIKQHRPRFNIRLRDDKSYPFLALSLADEFPRAMVRRGARPKGTRFFGPYANAYAIRETLDSLLRSFPVRTCTTSKFNLHQKEGRPCLLFHIEKCSGPCVGEVTKPAYDSMVEEFVRFLEGDTDSLVDTLEKEMWTAAEELAYERAARTRDRLASVRKAIERQQMVAEKGEDLDVIGLADDELEAAVQVFHVRRGRVVGRKGFVIDKVEDVTNAQLVAQVCEQLYGEDPVQGIPREVLVPELPEQAEIYEEYLSMLRAEFARAAREERRGGDSTVTVGESWSYLEGAPVTTTPDFERTAPARGPVASKVVIRVPQRGEKKALLDTVVSNAKEEFMRHKLRRASDYNARAKALNELQEWLRLDEAPLRIECYDNSHIQGSDYVSSMVVFEDGVANKREYRRFKVRQAGNGESRGNDDFAAMEEVLTRRLSHWLEEREKPVEERGGRFKYPPNLLVIDGGKGQLTSAMKVLEELGLDEEIAVCSLAKQFEEVFVPWQTDAIRIPRQSEALYLLQNLRDEAHRFAITYHRELRGKRMTKSALDDIAGLGPTRRSRLTRELGGVGAVKKASLEQLRALTWLPDTVAVAVFEKIHGPGSSAATSAPSSTESSLGAVLPASDV
jgi:excinuclease ABC subunit C